MSREQPLGAAPNPASDWICQREVAGLLGITEQTASVWSRKGRLKVFEHGATIGGRRKYSRSLVERELRSRWEHAVLALDGARRAKEVVHLPQR